MKSFLRSYAIILIGIFLLSASACQQQLDSFKPKSVQESIALSVATLAQVRTTTADLLKAKQITVEQAQYVQDMANNVRAGLNLAANFSKIGKPTDAESTLKLANMSLAAVQDYLTRAKEAK